MTTILKSTLATYLLDEEVEFDTVDQAEQPTVEQRNQYPEGFFSSL